MDQTYPVCSLRCSADSPKTGQFRSPSIQFLGAFAQHITPTKSIVDAGLLKLTTIFPFRMTTVSILGSFLGSRSYIVT